MSHPELLHFLKGINCVAPKKIILFVPHLRTWIDHLLKSFRYFPASPELKRNFTLYQFIKWFLPRRVYVGQHIYCPVLTFEPLVSFVFDCWWSKSLTPTSEYTWLSLWLSILILCCRYGWAQTSSMYRLIYRASLTHQSVCFWCINPRGSVDEHDASTSDTKPVPGLRHEYRCSVTTSVPSYYRR